MNRLRLFHTAWVNAWLTRKQIDHWDAKFNRNAERMDQRFDICGQHTGTDNNTTDDGERRRRRDNNRFSDKLSVDVNDESLRISEDPMEALKQITGGYARWSKRYLSKCKHHPQVQVMRSEKWFEKLRQKFKNNHPGL